MDRLRLPSVLRTRQNARAEHAIFDRLELEPSVCFHRLAATSNHGEAD
jgi:hypothetical protein